MHHIASLKILEATSSSFGISPHTMTQFIRLKWGYISGMCITSIAEQFTKLQQNAAFKIIERFSKDDIRGTFAVRNFIAHDYDGVNLSIVEDVIRERLPEMKKICEDIVKPFN